MREGAHAHYGKYRPKEISVEQFHSALTYCTVEDQTVEVDEPGTTVTTTLQAVSPTPAVADVMGERF